MTVKIGEKIKELRKKADVTQERFAEYLGVTAQAVSKWEVESGYPDIELLPPIANFFNITIDELMGFDISKNQEKIDRILRQLTRYSLKGKAAEFLRNAVQEFPNHYELLYYLAYYLKSEGSTDEEKLKNVHESISICKRILEDCTNDETLRSRSLQNLACSYNQIGDKRKAIETAKKLPSTFISRESVLAEIIGENYESGLNISAKKNSIMIEDLELFADEKNIQPIFESLEFLFNISGYINIDFWSVRTIVKNNSAYFANYIQIREITEDIDTNLSNKDCVKGAILDIKASPTGTTLDDINKFVDNIVKSFEYEDGSVVFGIRFDDTMNDKEVVASVIELSSRA